MEKNIVFFDSHCNLCSKAVDVLIRMDRNKRLLYAPISGNTAKKFGLTPPENEEEKK